MKTFIGKQIWRCALLLAAVALMTSLPAIADEAPPTGEQILDRYIQVTGGRAAYDKLNNRHSVVTLVIGGLGLAMDVELYQAKPNLFYSRVSSDATGDIERGTDGKVFWEKSTMAGARILDGTEAADALREANFDKMVYWKDLYKSADYAGGDTIDGVYCHKVVLTPAEGSPMTLAFDAESGLLTQVETVIEHQMGQIPLIAKSSDYREIDGIKVSYLTEVEVMGQTRTMTLKLIEHNIQIPDSIFQVPEDVKAMMAEE